jgi:hypothetical protein
MKYLESYDVSKDTYKRRNARGDAGHVTMASLFGPENRNDDTTLRLSLPNGVVLACPLSIKSNVNGVVEMKSFDIVLACQTSSGDVQTIQFQFDQCILQGSEQYHCNNIILQ